MKELSHIKEVIEKTISENGIIKERMMIMELWEKETGEYSNLTELMDLKEGVLIVKVGNHVLMQELNMRRNEIMKKINSVINREKIKRILFRI